MSRRNRERREKNRLLKGAIPLPYPKLADAVHRVVCSYTKSDGCGDCLTYAIAACAWLNATTRIPHALAGGYFNYSIEGLPPIYFEHFWVMTGTPENWTYLDFATRHNSALIRRGVAKHHPDFVLDSSSFDEKSIGIPFYVGNAKGLPWQYILLTESSIHAQREYDLSDKAEVVARLSRFLQ